MVTKEIAKFMIFYLSLRKMGLEISFNDALQIFLERRFVDILRMIGSKYLSNKWYLYIVYFYADKRITEKFLEDLLYGEFYDKSNYEIEFRSRNYYLQIG